MFYFSIQMANTYSQLYTQLVFAVKGRQSLIQSDWKETLYKYIAGIISNQKQKLMIINGMPDHVHILIGIKPDKSISDLVRDIKHIPLHLFGNKVLSRDDLNGKKVLGHFQ
jgi:REP element-mobilizing transposase RayT